LRWQEQGTKLEASLLWQYQDWDVAFPEGEDWDWTTDSVTGTRRYYKVSRESDTRLDWRRDWWQARIEGTLPWRDDHELGAGLSTRYGVETAKAQLARLLSGMILGTLENPLDMLGMVDEDGFTIRDNSEDRDFVSEILQNVMLQDSLRQKYWTVDGWVTDLWDVTPETRIRSGVRLEGDTRSGTLWPSPRVQVQHKLTEQDNLGVGIALHTQNEMALEWQLDAPKTLKPQKSAIASVEWERDLGNSWQFELNGWGKGYWDLVAPRMGYTGNVDSTLLHNNLEQWVTDLYNQQVLKSGTADSLVRRANQDGWQDYLYDATFRAQLRSLDPAGYDRAVMLSRQRRLLQSNSGVGFAAGLESSLRYHPADFWMGWLSGEVALSRRRDSVGGLWYNFGVDRRWKLSWVNAFQMPSRYELTLRYTAMSGMPYTPFTGGIFGGSSDTLFWVGKRNSSWFSPYQRLDFKLSKRSTLIRKPFVSYLEIWNAWNDPNWLLRDSETKQFRWINYNIPVPTVFLGCELRF
jgi:hypothetical protein